MKIIDLKNTPIKVCDLSVNNGTGRNLWNISWNELVDKKILTQDNGRCYYIVVNGIIHKIGFSDCLGGIKSTINSYRNSGNSGRPSDRTHGIHVLITEELLKGNCVEFWFHYNPLLMIDLYGMDGNIKTINHSISGKILETINIEYYYEKMGQYPLWNLQESKKSWHLHIQKSRGDLLKGIPLTINDIKKRLEII
jgi:hypothetical protein